MAKTESITAAPTVAEALSSEQDHLAAIKSSNAHLRDDVASLRNSVDSQRVALEAAVSRIQKLEEKT